MSISELTRRFASGNGAIFVGAGLSMGAGMPGWTELIEPLRARLQGLKPQQIFTPEQIAGWYEIDAGRPALVDFLKEQLGQRNIVPSDCHRILARLPVDLFFTTNFDDLLERSLVDADVVVNDMDFSALDDPHKKQLIKVHGDLSDRESIVFTKSDYDHYLENRPAIAETIRLTLMRRTVLFLGYSFSDRDLTTILSQVGSRLGDLRRPLFTILINPNKYAVKELEKKYGVHVIELLVAPTGDACVVLRAWLEDFENQIERERAKKDAARRSLLPVSNLPDHCLRFVGRDSDISNVMSALGTSRIVGIQGFPGTGKTALAIEVARRCEYGRKPQLKRDEMLFAYALYIDARGFDESSPLLDHILDKIADVFKIVAVKQLDASRIDEKKEQIVALLKIFRVLIIIDQLETVSPAEFWDWVKEVPEPSAILLVSRSQLSNVREPVRIGGMEVHDARDFLRAHLQNRTVNLSEAKIAKIIATVHGNPQGMKMLVGQFTTCGIPAKSEHELELEKIGMYEACSHVLEQSWNLLSERGRTVLMAASVFATHHIPLDALRHATALADSDAYAAAVQECQNLLLLEFCTEPRLGSGRVEGYTLHPMTAYLARSELEKCASVKSAFHVRLADYYLAFVRRAVVRPNPAVSYWNALVTQNMLEIDDEWPTIRHMLEWAVQHDGELLINLTFLLVHYMDTRLLNGDRIHFVSAAIEALHTKQRIADEALLRIDGLSWTLVEESRFAEAEEQICRGMALVEQTNCAEKVDLMPLALAWLARANCEQGKTQDAKQLIDQALAACGTASAWIAYRVRMVAGDICVKRNACGAAVELYKECMALVATYGGEEGYQILPRLGMAYLGSGLLDQAKAVFSELLRVSSSDHIDIGSLYARYGLAIIARKSDSSLRNSAANQLEQIRARLAQTTSSNLLLRLMDEVER